MWRRPPMVEFSDAELLAELGVGIDAKEDRSAPRRANNA